MKTIEVCDDLNTHIEDFRDFEYRYEVKAKICDLLRLIWDSRDHGVSGKRCLGYLATLMEYVDVINACAKTEDGDAK